MCHFKCIIKIVFTIAAWLSITPDAFGEFIISTNPYVSQESENIWQYKYSVINQSTGTESLYRFSLAVDIEALLSEIQGPPGWDVFYTAGTSDITFFSASTTVDIGPGSGAVFVFVANREPNAYAAELAGEDVNEQVFIKELLLPAPGRALPVPEPSSLALMSVALLGGGILVLHRFTRHFR